MTSSYPVDIRQYATHDQYVGHGKPPATSQDERRLDAIVVPASRGAANLDCAISLARAAQCQLLILCSRDAHAAEVSDLLEARLFTQAIAIDLPAGYTHRLFDFGTSQLGADLMPKACANRNTDLSMKRNLGLAMARMLDWRSIFFMDDDIRDVATGDLHATVTMLASYRSVGMRVSSFPDNSVVCHAHRMTGAFQDVLVSGSALAVDCTAPLRFFPNIYNEDWLFFHDDIAAGRLGSSGRNATQLHYDPFADPERAQGQEFGDVLAEGLYAQLHQAGQPASADSAYWAEFLEARGRFLADIVSRSDAAPAPVRSKLLAAVEAAQKCLLDIDPENCVQYIKTWRDDITEWQSRLQALPVGLTASAALAELDLRSAGTSEIAHWVTQSPAESTSRAEPGPVLISSVPTLAQPVLPSPPAVRVTAAAAVSTALVPSTTPEPASPPGRRPVQFALAGRSFGMLLSVQVLGGIMLLGFHQLGAVAGHIGLDAPYVSFPRLAIGSALILGAGLTAAAWMRWRRASG